MSEIDYSRLDPSVQWDFVDRQIRSALGKKRVRMRLAWCLRLKLSVGEIAGKVGFEESFVPLLIRRFLLTCGCFDFKKSGEFSEKDLIWMSWMYNYGFNERSIAKAVGCGAEKVRSALRKRFMGYRLRNKEVSDFTEEDWSCLKCLFFGDLSPEQVAQTTMLDVDRVRECFDLIVERHTPSHERNKDLTWDDYKIIEWGLKMGLSHRKIAGKIGCAHRTVDRIVNNYKEDFSGVFKADVAFISRMARKHSKRGRYKTENIGPFLQAFKKAYEAKEASPKSFCAENILGVGGFDEAHSVSYQTLYDMLQKGELDVARRPKPHKKAEDCQEERKSEIKPNIRPMGLPYEDLPEKYCKDGYTTQVCVEMDTVEGTRDDKSRILTMWLDGSKIPFDIFLESGTAECLKAALAPMATLLSLIDPAGIHYVLIDNGTEFARAKDVDELVEKLFSTHPQRPTEKPHVERHNQDLRLFFPKHESLGGVTPEMVREASRKLALKRVDSLFWASPWECFKLQVRENYGFNEERAKVVIRKFEEFFGMETK